MQFYFGRQCWWWVERLMLQMCGHLLKLLIPPRAFYKTEHPFKRIAGSQFKPNRRRWLRGGIGRGWCFVRRQASAQFVEAML